MAEKACHVFGSTTQVGLTQALGRMENISALVKRYSNLPSLLKVVTLACIFVGLSTTLAPLVPGMSLGLDGTVLTWHQLWQTRIALALLALGPFMMVVGIGSLMGRGWARPTLVLMPLLQVVPLYLVHWLLAAPAPIRSVSVPTYLLLCAVWASIAYLYLYKYSAARKHFADAA